MNATDPDLGAGGSVLYSFQPPSPFFAIDSARGIVTVVRELDYETTQAYQLTVNATVSPAPQVCLLPPWERATVALASSPAGRGPATVTLAIVTVRARAVPGPALKWVASIKPHGSPLPYVI